MKHIKMASSKFTFIARLEEKKSPQTCKWFLNLLPFTGDMIQVLWSGFACFILLDSSSQYEGLPATDVDHTVPFENPIRIPSKGEIIMYPGNMPHLQEGGEIFMAWGPCKITCQNGNLMGNHFLTIVEGNENLEEFGITVLTKGAQTMCFELIK
jgi:hypothetical protein